MCMYKTIAFLILPFSLFLRSLFPSVLYCEIGKKIYLHFFLSVFLFPWCLRPQLSSHTDGRVQGFSDNLGLLLSPLRTDAFVKFNNKMNFLKSGHLLTCLGCMPFI